MALSKSKEYYLNSVSPHSSILCAGIECLGREITCTLLGKCYVNQGKSLGSFAVS